MQGPGGTSLRIAALFEFADGALPAAQLEAQLPGVLKAELAEVRQLFQMVSKRVRTCVLVWSALRVFRIASDRAT